MTNQTSDTKTDEQIIRNGIAFLKSIAKKNGWVLHVKFEQQREIDKIAQRMIRTQ